jgi:hypothetical protein
MVRVEALLRTRGGRTAMAALAILAGWGALRLASPNGQPLEEPTLMPSPSPTGVNAVAGIPPIDNFGHYLCAPVAPYAAYADPRRYYPLDHPALPPDTVRPAACFGTEVAALTAGYARAATPVGYIDEGAVYLGSASKTFERSCPAASAALGYAVPCPSLLPLPTRGAELPGCGPQGSAAPGCVDQRAEFSFPGQPPVFSFQSSGDTVTLTDVLIQAFPADNPPGPFSDAHCDRGPPVGTVVVGGDLASYFVCGGETPLVGHLMLRWTHGRVTCQVALLPNSDIARRVALDIAEHIRYVSG